MPRRDPITDVEKDEAKTRRKRRRLLRKVKKRQGEIRTKKPAFSADTFWGPGATKQSTNGGPEGNNGKNPFVRTKPSGNGASTVTQFEPITPVVLGRGRPCLLTIEVSRSIAENIRAGAYFNVAVRASGVAVRTAGNWRKKGDEGIALIESERGSEIRIEDFKYVQFTQSILQAEGEARLKAEQMVYAADPRFWLRVGPGRDKPEDPGWSERVEHSGPGGKGIPLSMSIEDLVSRAILPDYSDKQS